MKDYKNKKEFKKALMNMDAVEIYKEVLRGKYIKRFPKGFWQRPDALENAKKVTKYLIENVLEWNDEDIKEKLIQNIFRHNGLYGMFSSCFNYSPYKAIDNAYPGKFKPWELKSVSQNYWNKDTARKATKWLIKEKLEWNDEDIKNKLDYNVFYDNGLYGMIHNYFNDSPYKAIDNAYPGKFKPWELKSVSQNYWNKDTARKATKWLIEEKLEWNDEDIKNKLDYNVFYDNGLVGILSSCFNYSPYKAIDNVYPGKFKPWELKSVSQNYWNKDTARKATKWLIKEKLKWNDEDIKNKLDYNTFINNGLYGMLSSCFNYSPYKAIDNVYPGKFKKEDFKNYR